MIKCCFIGFFFNSKYWTKVDILEIMKGDTRKMKIKKIRGITAISNVFN